MKHRNFWKKLPRPFFALAPMADVTDSAFRRIIAKYGKPDVFWTEFVSADGLAHPKAREKLLIDLKYSKNEHPIVAQIFGSNLTNLEEATRLIVDLGFDGVDINMGCPDKAIERQKAGSACIKDPIHAKAIIQAVKNGAQGKIPVSVKTRIGYNKEDIDAWITCLLEEDIDALTVHLRTRKEMSKVPARWELVPKIVALRDAMQKDTLIVGNGDVADLNDAKEKAENYGCDGVMLGRAIFGNPRLFNRQRSKSKFSQVLGCSPLAHPDHSKVLFASLSCFHVKRKLKIMLEHTKLFEKMLGEHKNFAIMKKHYKAYVNGWEGAKELRVKLMDTTCAKDVERIVRDFLKNY